MSGNAYLIAWWLFLSACLIGLSSKDKFLYIGEDKISA